MLKNVIIESIGYIGVFLIAKALKSESEKSRYFLVRFIGKSGDNFASSVLQNLMEDPCYEIRREAVKNLGEIKAYNALNRIIKESLSKESDIRIEAIEALGSIGGQKAQETLFSLIHEDDLLINISALSALGRIGDEKTGQRLLDYFEKGCSDYLFPTLADTLSRLGISNSVEFIMFRLPNFKENIHRFQLLNSVCRVLGAGNEFYSLLSKDEYSRISRLYEIIINAQKNVRKSSVFSQKELAASINGILARIVRHYRNENHSEFLKSMWEIMAYIQLVVPEFRRSEDVSLRLYIEAVNIYLTLKKTEEIKNEGMIFLVIILGLLIERV